MRWRDLFSDLEGQAAAWEQRERDVEVADRSRAEQGRVALVERVSAATGRDLLVRLHGGAQVHGTIVTVGADWMLVERTEPVEESLVLLGAVVGIADLDRRAHSEAARGVVMSRLRAASPLRAMARDRSAVRVVLTDGSLLAGTLQLVGKDHLDLLLHDVEEAPRPEHARGRLTVPLQALAVLHRGSSRWT